MGFDNELGAFKEFVKRDHLRRYQMPMEELKGGVLVLIDSVVCLKLLKGADNNHRPRLVKKQLLAGGWVSAKWSRIHKAIPEARTKAQAGRAEVSESFTLMTANC